MRFKDQFGNVIKPEGKAIEKALTGFSRKIIEEDSGISIEKVEGKGLLIDGDSAIPDTFKVWEEGKVSDAVDFFWGCCSCKQEENR